MFVRQYCSPRSNLPCLLLTIFLLLLWIFLTFFSFLGYKLGDRNEDPNLSPLIRALIPIRSSSCQSESVFNCPSCLDCTFANSSHTFLDSVPDWSFKYQRDGQNLGFSDDMCQAAFPGMFEDVERAITHYRGRRIEAQDIQNIKMQNGMVHAMIYKRHLYVLRASFRDDVHRERGLGTLSAIQRSITAAPLSQRIPDIEFMLNVEDYSPDTTLPLWALCRQTHDENTWLIPDFGFWSWSMSGVDGPFDEIVTGISSSEVDLCYACKKRKAVWRGSLWTAQLLRRALIDASKDKSWSDVQVVGEDNHMSVTDQCDYMFSIHAEGRSYSGSLKYRQACRSVVIIHKLQWIQHHHYLLISEGPHQNYVSVERDFSDLDARIRYLLDHPAEAERIAENNVRTFRERYLTAAAEACYWRRLYQGWSEVSFPSSLYSENLLKGAEAAGLGKARGMRYETFMIIENTRQMNFEHKIR